MKLVPLPLPGLLRLEPTVIRDSRGFFAETYRKNALLSHGVDVEFVQDNHSRSAKHVLRGLHFQRAGPGGPGQAKLVRVARGAIFDVAVDIRQSSPTFGHWHGEVLDDENNAQLYLPVGFAHGFCVLSDVTDVVYKVSSVYDGSTECGFAFDDVAVGVKWPVPRGDATLSKRDIEAPPLSAIRAQLFP